MLVKSFAVGYSRTVNLGNYESARIEASVTVELADGDDRTEAQTQAQFLLRQMLERTWREQYVEHKK